MNTSLLTVRVSPTIKLSAQKAAKKIGLPLSAVINNYLREFIKSEVVTFQPTIELTPKQANKIDILVQKSLDSGLSPSFTNVADAIAYLHE